MAEITIYPVQDKKDLEEFITFPWTIYADDPYWVPPLINERKTFLDFEQNHFFEHARAQYFIAKQGQQKVGTIAAFTNDRYNEFHNENKGWFGFFEVMEIPEAAQALFDAVEDWNRKAGHESILGPAQFSTNDELGLLVDGFNDLPRILMTYNPQYYSEYILAAGYNKAMDLWAHSLVVKMYEEEIPEKLVRVVEMVRKRGPFHIRPVNLKQYDREIEIVRAIYNKSWERNWGFVPFTDPEFDKLAEDLRQIIDPALSVIVEKEGEAVGFGILLPDLNQPLRLAYPRPGMPETLTMLKLLWHWKVRRKVDWVRGFALGVLPEFRGRGVDAMMYLELIKGALARGFTWAELSWTLETNFMINRSMELLGAKVYKTYRMYEKQLQKPIS
jgi:GNAT superfamily N-acetyltransferase